MPSARGLTATLLATVLLVAACGDADEADGAGTAAETTVTTAAEADTGFTGEDSDRFCELARELDDQDPFEQGDLDLAEAFRDAVTSVDEIIGVAPAEIRSEFETLREGLQEVASAIEDADGNLFAVDPERLESLEDPRYERAADRIDAYLRDVCGIEIDDDELDPPMIELEGAEGGLAGLLGITEDEARCLLEESGLEELDPENPDIAALFEAFDVCGVELG
jgi:hypothetical protein